jgi:cystathionine beta-lyase/cystathionine gamma-synthase
VVSFILKGGHDSAALFIDSLKIPYIAPSLGGVESLVEQPSVISYWDKTAAVGTYACNDMRTFAQQRGSRAFE